MSAKLSEIHLSVARYEELRGYEVRYHQLYAYAEAVLQCDVRCSCDVCFDAEKTLERERGAKNPNEGSSFDDFLKEEDIYEESTAIALKRVLTWRIKTAAEALEQQSII